MLEVAVHDHDDPSLAQAKSGHDGTAQATDPLAGLTMEDEDGQGGGLRNGGHDRRCVIAAVVDEYHL